jgi:hypothetical protein
MISLTFEFATGVTVIISVFSLLAGSGDICYTHIVPQHVICQFRSIGLVSGHKRFDARVSKKGSRSSGLIAIQLTAGMLAVIEISIADVFDKLARFP